MCLVLGELEMELQLCCLMSASLRAEESPRNGSIRGHLEVSPSPGLLQELTDARRQHSKSHRRTKGGRRKSRGQKPESRQGENGGSEFDSPSGRGVRHLKVSSQGSTVLFSGSYDQSPSPPRLRVPSGEGDGIPASSDESSISGGSSPEREVSPHRSHRLAVPDSGMPAPRSVPFLPVTGECSASVFGMDVRAVNKRVHKYACTRKRKAATDAFSTNTHPYTQECKLFYPPSPPLFFAHALEDACT